MSIILLSTWTGHYSDNIKTCNFSIKQHKVNHTCNKSITGHSFYDEYQIFDPGKVHCGKICFNIKLKVHNRPNHYSDVIMGTIASQITSLTIIYSAVYSDADQRKHQSSASLAFVRWIPRGPVNSPHKWPVTRKMFPFDDVIMYLLREWLPAL